jgi:hypothetical protein
VISNDTSRPEEGLYRGQDEAVGSRCDEINFVAVCLKLNMILPTSLPREGKFHGGAHDKVLLLEVNGNELLKCFH